MKELDLLLLASFGLAVNLIVAFILKGSHQHDEDAHAPEDLNVKSAMLHVLGDAIASCGVITAALIIWRTGWASSDPIASVIISLIILASSYRLMRDSFRIMMDGVPS